MTYINRPSPHSTAVNAVNADAMANTAESNETSVTSVDHPKSPAKETADRGSKPPPSNYRVWVSCSKHWKKRRQTYMDDRIDWGVTNMTVWVCRPHPPCNDPHWALPQNGDSAVKGGKPKGGKPKGGGDKGAGGGKGSGGDQGGKAAPYGRGRW